MLNVKELAGKKDIRVESSGKLIYIDEKRGDLTVHIKAKEDIENGVGENMIFLFFHFLGVIATASKILNIWSDNDKEKYGNCDKNGLIFT